jgi:hypothetical protein
MSPPPFERSTALVPAVTLLDRFEVSYLPWREI